MFWGRGWTEWLLKDSSLWFLNLWGEKVTDEYLNNSHASGFITEKIPYVFLIYFFLFFDRRHLGNKVNVPWAVYEMQTWFLAKQTFNIYFICLVGPYLPIAECFLQIKTKSEVISWQQLRNSKAAMTIQSGIILLFFSLKKPQFPNGLEHAR